MSNPNSPPVGSPDSPRLVGPLAAAILLAFCGGYGDATGYLLAQTFTGHVTGNLVLLAIALLGAHPAQTFPRIASIISFLAATGAGFLLTGWSRRYATPLAFLAQTTLLLFVVAPNVRHSASFPLLLTIALSLSLGLQNGLVTSIDDVSLHSTFVSGDSTSLMSTWVKLWQHRRPGAKPPNPAKIPILFAVIVGFFAGAATARILSVPLGDLLPASLLVPLFAATLAYDRNVKVADPHGRTRGTT